MNKKWKTNKENWIKNQKQLMEQFEKIKWNKYSKQIKNANEIFFVFVWMKHRINQQSQEQMEKTHETNQWKKIKGGTKWKKQIKKQTWNTKTKMKAKNEKNK